MPPGLRRKSIAAGIRDATIIASWPAPLDRRWTGTPVRRTASSSAAVSDLLRRPAEARYRRRANMIIRVSHVERDDTHAGNHVCRARLRLDPSDGGDQAVRPARFLLHCRDPFGCAGERVTS